MLPSCSCHAFVPDLDSSLPRLLADYRFHHAFRPRFASRALAGIRDPAPGGALDRGGGGGYHASASGRPFGAVSPPPRRRGGISGDRVGGGPGKDGRIRKADRPGRHGRLRSRGDPRRGDRPGARGGRGTGTGRTRSREAVSQRHSHPHRPGDAGGRLSDSQGRSHPTFGVRRSARRARR